MADASRFLLVHMEKYVLPQELVKAFSCNQKSRADDREQCSVPGVRLTLAEFEMLRKG